MGTRLTKQLSNVRERYARDGHVIVRNVIDADLVQEARNHVE